MIKQGVILASGLGSRLNSEGRQEPKPLMPVGGMALIERVITLMQSAGIEKIVVVVGYRGNQIVDYIRGKNMQGVFFAENPEYTKKNGISLLRSKDLLDDAPFLLSMSDHIFSRDFFADFISKAESELESYDAVLSVDKNIEGVFDLDDATKVALKNNEIVSIGKELADFDAVDTGLFLCKYTIFPKLQRIYDENGDVSISEVMKSIAEDGKFVSSDMTGHLWQDVDTPSMKDEAEERLIDHAFKDDESVDFFSNKLFFNMAKVIVLALFKIEHFDWKIAYYAVFVVSLIVTALALHTGFPEFSVLPLCLNVLLFYIGKIRRGVRTVGGESENFVLSWNFNLLISVLPAMLSAGNFTLLGAILLFLSFFVVFVSFFMPSLIAGKIQLIPSEIANTFLSPSLFWICYSILIMILPTWLFGFIPFAYLIVTLLFVEKRD